MSTDKIRNEEQNDDGIDYRIILIWIGFLLIGIDIFISRLGINLLFSLTIFAGIIIMIAVINLVNNPPKNNKIQLKSKEWLMLSIGIVWDIISIFIPLILT